jgi:LAGLIDADG DNA endonuclease family
MKMYRINKQLLIGLSPNNNLVKEYKNSLTNLSKEQWDSSIGLILGDASLQTQNEGKTYRIKFEWSDKDKAYVNHVYALFDEWVISEPHKKTRISPKGNTIINWGFQTISHQAFKPLAELFINNNTNKKSVKDSLIKNHLTERGLAYWFMDDGGKLDYNKNSKNKSIVLNTHSFTELEVINMANELKDCFNFSTEVRTNKGKKIIVIKPESYLLFRSKIDNYIIPEMLRKLP